MAEQSHPVPDDLNGPAQTPRDAGSQALAEALRSSFAVVKFVMILLVVVFFASGLFLVGAQERVIILRFGKPQGQGAQALLGPGRLHWSFPYPIDELVRVPITGIQKVSSSVGWYATTPEQELAGTEPPPSAVLNPALDGYVLTADNNIIHTRATLTYRIEDPKVYVFSFVNASNAVQNALDNALLYAASHYQVDDILTRDIAGFQDAVRRHVVGSIEQQDLGIKVEQCTVQSIPPRQLKEAFDSVIKAEIMRNTLLTDARGDASTMQIKAGADAASRIYSAESYRATLVSEISSRAAQFQDLLPKWRDNPSLFVQQRLTEAVGRALTNAQDKVFVPDNADGNTMELRYLLNREPLKPKEETKP
jgi:membrane protease subunit HflK